ADRPQALAATSKYPGLARLQNGWEPRFLIPAIIASATGPPSVISSKRKSVAPSAFCESRLMDEINMPAASEQNNAFTRASELFQYCPPLTPPINCVIARIGSTASSAKNARNEVASSFPNPTS